jgi:hypothetical protein
VHPECRVLNLAIALQCDLYLGTGDAPCRLRSITGCKTEILYEKGVLPALLDQFTADIIIVLTQKKTAFCDTACLFIEVE